MPGLFLVNAQDVARVLGPNPNRVTVAEVADRLEVLYLGTRGGGFNHDTSIRATFDLFRGAITVEQAEAYCLQNGNPKGRAQNAQIVSAIGPYAAANHSRCHRIGYIAVAIGRHNQQTIFVGLKAPFIRVRRPGEAYLVIPGYRKASRPVGWQVDLVCSIAANQLARDDFEGAEVEYLAAGPAPNGPGRLFTPMLGRTMNLFAPDAIDQLMQIYVEAVVRHLERGNGTQPARFAGYRIIDPAQGRFL